MQLIPFTTKSVDVRVVNSPIGKVVPVVDIAKAIGYERNKLVELLNRSIELFEGTVGTVTVSSDFEQQSASGKIYNRTQSFNVQALNSYGVVGLLMKLDYNRVQDEGKKQNVIRFQKWAMQTLGNALNNKTRAKQPYLSQKQRYKHLFSLAILPVGYFYRTTEDIAAIAGVSARTVRRNIKSGKIKNVYRVKIGNKWVYAIKSKLNEGRLK